MCDWVVWCDFDVAVVDLRCKQRFANFERSLKYLLFDVVHWENGNNKNYVAAKQFWNFANFVVAV